MLGNSENSVPGPVEEVIEELVEAIIDLEEYARDGKKPPRARHYRIRIDKHKYEVAAPSLTGRQLLSLADKAPPERYLLSQKFRGGEVKLVALDAPVDLAAPGVERFMTLDKDQTEG